ncbi:mitochondrial carrier [Rozella allomycis CSF55]|uniref:Mitochondrial carrier n=1 Tax=Rozella allomycis (strain CSF55) TaxID=988480 RepID=A0A4P9YKR1_ROZAC|nr:mitochondrial carrier [Rozella allomycis CSF55]
MNDNIVHAIAGAGGGMISMALTYPLVTVATRLQVQKNDAETEAYQSTLDAFSKIIEKEGVKGLFSGLESGLFGIAVTNSVYYYWYETVRTYFMKKNANLSTFHLLLSGSIAGAVTTILTNPIWVVNTRLTAKKKSLDENEKVLKELSSWNVAWDILKDDGLLAFFQGILPALVLVINPTMQYFVFEKLKARQQDKKKNLTDFDFFLLGAISKLVATVKSRMQLKQSKDNNKRYAGIIDAFQKIFKEEGFYGLYKGLQSKASQSVLTAAILFLAKEKLFIFTMRLLTLLGVRTLSNKR